VAKILINFPEITDQTASPLARWWSDKL